MIPLHSIMDDIKTLMDAAIVRLPKSKSELWRVLNNQLHEEHAHTESKTDSFSPIDEKEFEIDSNNLDTPMTNDKAKQKNEVPVSVGPDDYPSALKSSERPPFPGSKARRLSTRIMLLARTHHQFLEIQKTMTMVTHRKTLPDRRNVA